MRDKDTGTQRSGLSTSMDGIKTDKPDDNAKPAADKVAAARKLLIDAMVQPRFCFMDNLDYAVRDADFLDRVLGKLLGQATLAEVAGDERELKNLTREAPAIYAAEQQTPDGLARLEKVVAARFAQPVVQVTADRTGKIAQVDYGHIAAKLHINHRKAIGIDFDASPHLLNREWRSSEVAAALKEQLDKHPEADGVELRVLIPDALIANEWHYTYRRGTDRVLITFPADGRRPRMSAKLGHDFTPYISGDKSLAHRDLEELNPALLQQQGSPLPSGH